MEYVLIKAEKSAREDLKVIAALTKESMQDVLKRLLAQEKARVLAAAAGSSK